jgi:hypothetical protein
MPAQQQALNVSGNFMRTLSFTIFLTLTLTIAVKFANGQVNDQNIQLQVLEKSITDSEFVFGNWEKKEQTETHLKYLGQVTTKSGKTFKIVNSVFIWGLSQRATSRILIFNEQNQYVGNYYLTTDEYLPDRLKNGRLIFNNRGNDCDKKLITVINLKNGLPKQFFRKCKEKFGDTFSFESD